VAGVHRCGRAAHHSLNPSTAARPNPGLGELADRHVSVAGGAGVAAGAKVSALIAGMVAGAASIADMGLAPDPLHGQRAEPRSGDASPSPLRRPRGAFRAAGNG
jgi:hypothetical protein